MFCRILIVSQVILWASLPVFAHESPNTMIDELSHTMSTDGPSPELLLERAYEYRAIDKMHLAEMDLKLSIHMKVDYAEAYVALGRLYLHEDKIQLALDTVGKGLSVATQKDVRAQLNGLVAEGYEAQDKSTEALEAINKALESTSPDLNWILTKCRLLKKLGLHTERIATARKAHEDNGAVVLAIELVDALRDAGEFEECLERINGYIAKRRFKAEWYLRRAEVYRVMKEESKAQVDATLALEELQQRMRATKPAVHLYEDIARAYTFLGETAKHDEALSAIVKLKEKG